MGWPLMVSLTSSAIGYLLSAPLLLRLGNASRLGVSENVRRLILPP